MSNSLVLTRLALPYAVRAVLAAGLTLFLNGCFADRIQRSDEQDIRRIESKQAALLAERNNMDRLKKQEAQLAEELSTREVTLSDLDQRIHKLQAANGTSIADNDAAQAHYHELLAQLHDSNEQLVALQMDSRQQRDDQRQRVLELKADLQNQLRSILH